MHQRAPCRPRRPSELPFDPVIQPPIDRLRDEPHAPPPALPPRLYRGTMAAGVLLDLSRDMGQASQDLLSGTGLRPLDLEDGSLALSTQLECRLIENLMRHAPHREDLGLKAGGRFRFLHLGALGPGLINAPDLRGAFRFAEAFADLGVTFVRLSLDEAIGSEGIVGLSMIPPPAASSVHRFAVERMVATVHVLARALLGRPLQAIRMEFSFPRPSDPELYAPLNARQILFGQPQDRLILSATDLDQPLLAADPQALQRTEVQCRQALATALARPGLSGRVAAMVLERHGPMPDMGEVAVALCMSERTLRRRLSEEGSTFAAIADGARRAMAEQLLGRDGLAIEQIADRLGFAEAACFIHAFKRWHGQTPHAFRRSRGVSSWC